MIQYSKQERTENECISFLEKHTKVFGIEVVSWLGVYSRFQLLLDFVLAFRFKLIFSSEIFIMWTMCFFWGRIKVTLIVELCNAWSTERENEVF